MKNIIWKAEDFGATKVTLIIFKKEKKCIWVFEGNVDKEIITEFKKLLNEWNKSKREDFLVASPSFEKIVI
jgi:hypothetical protein